MHQTESQITTLLGTNVVFTDILSVIPNTGYKGREKGT